MEEHMKTRSIVIASILTAALLQSGCIHYKQLIPPSALIMQDPGPMDVLMKDGTIYRLDDGVVSLNVISGYGDKFLLDGERKSFSGVLPFSEINLVQTSRVDGLGSLLTYGSIGVLIVATAGARSSSENLDVRSQIRYPPSGGGGGGSCPYVFSFDGTDYHFESETFAGALCQGLERTNLEPLRYLTGDPQNLQLAIANQLEESEHVNELALLEVDHPSGTRVVTDALGGIHTISAPALPSAAFGFDNKDAIDLICKSDGRMWESNLDRVDPDKDEQLRDGIVCEFARPAGAVQAKLLITCRNSDLGYFALQKLFSLEGPDRLKWYHQLNSDQSARNQLMSWVMREGGLDVSLWADNVWVAQGMLPQVGPRVTAEKVAILDLKCVKGDRIKVKLESSTDLWRIDAVAIDYSPDEKVRIMPARLVSAITAAGQSISDRIAAADSTYYSMLPGDYAFLKYEASAIRPGYKRTYLLKSRGFYYTWGKSGATDNSALVEHILHEPLLGSRLYLSEWKQVRQQYAATEENRPQFSATGSH